MRQVDEAELVWLLKYQLSRLSATRRADLASRHPETRRRAEQEIALTLARQALYRFEILSASPIPPGSDLFSNAAYGTGAGHTPKITEMPEPTPASPSTHVPPPERCALDPRG